MAPRHGAEQDHLEQLVVLKCIGAGLAISRDGRDNGARLLEPGARLLPRLDGLRGQGAVPYTVPLDKRNQIIADEVQQKGTVDHAPVHEREVVKRALELSAT